MSKIWKYAVMDTSWGTPNVSPTSVHRSRERAREAASTYNYQAWGAALYSYEHLPLNLQQQRPRPTRLERYVVVLWNDGMRACRAWGDCLIITEKEQRP